MFSNHTFIRNVHIGDLLESFLVSAISSILFIRFFLAITGYPQIGGAAFHIAHMLWGGFLLMIALVMTLSFLGNKILRAAAIIGGVGFGVFIDELGKFITRDNNYFFEPTIAILYIIFLILFFIFRYLDQHQPLSDKEYVMNAFQLFEEVISEDMDREEKRKLMQYIKHAKKYPFAVELQTMANSIETVPPKNHTVLQRFTHRVNAVSHTLVGSVVFRKFVIAFFVLQALVTFSNIILIATTDLENIPFLLPDITNEFAVTVYGEVFSILISGGLVIAGVLFFRFDRTRAYEFFKYSILVSILFTQFFVFYREQFQALFGLTLNLITLAVLNFVLKYERKHETELAHAAA